LNIKFIITWLAILIRPIRVAPVAQAGGSLTIELNLRTIT
jgi:hypothetical protein